MPCQVDAGDPTRAALPEGRRARREQAGWTSEVSRQRLGYRLVSGVLTSDTRRYAMPNVAQLRAAREPGATPLRASSRAGASRAGARQRLGSKRRSRRLLLTTNTELKAIAAPAMRGLSRPERGQREAATL